MRLDEFMPEYEFNEVHAVTVHALPERVFGTIKELTYADISLLVSLLFNVRNLPAKLMGKQGPTVIQPGPFLEQLYQGGFIPLAEEPGREIVFGLVGQFWKLTGGEAPHIPDQEAFLAYNDPTFGKVAANLLVTDGANGRTRCSTETRVYVPEPSTRRKFAFYWWIISTGSALIRVLWLQAIKRKAEQD